MNHSILRIFLSGFFLLWLGKASADVTVLVHGYLGDSGSWERSGASAHLYKAGLQPAGILGYSYEGVTFRKPVKAATDKPLYSVELPSKAPLMQQTDWLQAMLRTITKRHPGEKITLIGHSAGGVIARMVLVRHGVGNVNRLITIAAPHLGTDKALQALNATNNSGMFGFVKNWVVRDAIGDGMYDTLQQSRGILIDLRPPEPGSALYWLNLQTHPDIEYISVIRNSGYNIRGDIVVPPISQDMNRVPALMGKSLVVLTAQGHELEAADGKLLTELLK